MTNSNGYRFWSMVASGFGLGHSPKAPGTVGAAGAMIPTLLLLHFTSAPYLWLGFLIIIFGILGTIAANRIEAKWGHDSPRIVIDEMVGMWISVMWIGTGWLVLLISFLLFRFFDIVKPAGIRKLEKLPGGIGIMADDVAAGIAANLLLQTGLLLSTLMCG